MIFLLNQKPDTSLAQKSGHFYLLTTIPSCRPSYRSPENLTQFQSMNALTYSHRMIVQLRPFRTDMDSSWKHLTVECVERIHRGSLHGKVVADA